VPLSCAREERFIGAAPFSKRSRTSASAHGQVGARTHGQVQIRNARQWCAARIDHDEPRAGLLRALDVRDQVMPDADGLQPQTTISRACS
jgi:hypothetical protein